MSMVALTGVALVGALAAWLFRRMEKHDEVSRAVFNAKLDSIHNETNVKLDGIHRDVKRINGNVADLTARAQKNSERIARLEGQNHPGP